MKERSKCVCVRGDEEKESITYCRKRLGDGKREIRMKTTRRNEKLKA